MPTPEDRADNVRQTSVRKLLLYLGSAMVGAGQAVYDVEEEVRRVAWELGYPNAQVSATPTGVTISLASGEPAALEMSPAPLALGQATTLNDIRRGLLDGRLGIAPALAQLSALRGERSRYSRLAFYGGNVLIAVALALILQPVLANVVAAAVLSLLVSTIRRVAERFPGIRMLAPTLSAFVVGLAAFALDEANVIDGPLRTMVAPLVVFLPGGAMATGMAELAGGAMIAGVSRFFHGIVQLLMLALGLSGASMVTSPPMSALMNVRVHELGPLALPAGIVLLGLGIALVESLPWRLLPWILGLLLVTFFAQALGQALSGDGTFGAFIGGTAASFGAMAVTAARANVPRLVVFTPAFWLLAPGSLGLIGVTTLGLTQETGLTLTHMITLTTAIALGLLVGSSLGRPIHRLRRTGTSRRRTPQQDQPQT